ncbi:hypothetical protein GIB67_040986 [Kingdonia uniflora]|uniref:Uncharacterized protein n=1 Tax=Kingdonia uniflora TaxID=39325 RepID=A0A7J7NCF1_9MAGN|nr:hypothetical protein GIB67_040986 [Kingdonia uniflora]
MVVFEEPEEIQGQSNPAKDKIPQIRFITALPDGVKQIFHTSKDLTNHDSMRPHGTFTTVIKVWNEISIISTIRDPVVKIFGRFMDIKLGNSDNRLIQALERWWLITHTFLFPCAEMGITPLDFTMLTSLPIGKNPTPLSYDDR